jgi:AraC-like DNA-binding protein
MHSQGTVLQERKPITGFKFSTESFRKQDQFDAWCEFTSSMCDLEAIAPPKKGFIASAESYHLGSLLLTSFQLSPMKFDYTKDIIRRSNFDHWCLSVVTKGTVAAGSADRGFNAAAGGTVLHSYATPFSGRMEVTNYSGLFFSRDEFWDVANELDSAAHQQVGGPMSHIVGDFLASLQSRAHELTMQEAVAVNEAFGHLLRAMVHQTPTSFEAARVPIAAAQFDRARRFINQNLKSPGLSPHAICASLGVSRRQLYYLFEQHGGVMTFIRNRRLSACYDLLTKPTDRKLISTIAYEYGFINLSSFYRQFHARYGFNPGEARSAWSSGLTFATRGDNTFVDWLLRTVEN